MLSAATATGGGSATRVALDGSARLAYTVTPAAHSLSTQVNSGPWTIDWSAMTTSAAGAPLDPLAVQRLWIATIPGADEVTSAWLLDPEGASDLYYSEGVNNVSAFDPTDLLASNATYFEGFDTEQTWFVGLGCGTCPLASVPLYIGELKVVP
jgi:hypothetical protein